MDLTTTVTSIWDDAARQYDDAPGHGLTTPAERLVWLGFLADGFPPARPQRILDVGTGTGALALLLAELGHDVVGVDLSAEMLTIARTKADAGGLDLTFVEGDAEDPDVTGPFDAVVSRHLLWTLPDPVGAIAAWRDLTRSDGRLVAVDGVWWSDRPLDRLLGHLRRDEGTTRHQRDCDPYESIPDGSFPLQHVQSVAPAVAAFEAAGLREVRGRGLDEVDRLERATFGLRRRLATRWRRYLVEGSVR